MNGRIWRGYRIGKRRRRHYRWHHDTIDAYLDIVEEASLGLGPQVWLELTLPLDETLDLIVAMVIG